MAMAREKQSSAESGDRRCGIIIFPGTNNESENAQNAPPANKDEKPKEIKLKKDGTPKKICQNKKKGKSSKARHLDIEDIKKIANHFKEKKEWLSYLIFVLGCNMARRVGDTMSLTWEHFYNPETGKMRTNLKEIIEDKTDKLASPKINNACRDAIELYIEMTGCDPSKDNYTVPICMQLSGTYKGKVMTQDGYYRAIKRAAKALEIEYNIATHSTRKSFGMISKEIHPGDPYNMEILQTILNHSDAKTTRDYIGLTEQKVSQYFDDVGAAFTKYISGNEQYEKISSNLVVHLKYDDLIAIASLMYETGLENAGKTDPMVHANAMAQFQSMINELKV